MKKRSLHRPLMEKNSVFIIVQNARMMPIALKQKPGILAVRAMQKRTCSVNMKLALMIVVSAFTGILLYMIDEC
jgi:hypothetical protein